MADDQLRWLSDILGWMAVVVLPVFVLTPLFAWRYRRTNRRVEYRPDWQFSWPLEIAIWGVPVAIVVALAVMVAGAETRRDPYRPLASALPPLRVDVIALNWKFLFVYPKQHIATVDYMAFPDNRPVTFHLTSDATVQSFYIPALGSQIYAMGGMVTQLNLAANRPGKYAGENTQFNGMGFQHEHFTAQAMPPAAFAAWVARMQRAGRALDTASFARLAKDGTAAEAARKFGTTDGVVAFAPADAALFNAVVAKYQGAQTKRARGS